MCSLACIVDDLAKGRFDRSWICHPLGQSCWSVMQILRFKRGATCQVNSCSLIWTTVSEMELAKKRLQFFGSFFDLLLTEHFTRSSI